MITEQLVEDIDRFAERLRRDCRILALARAGSLPTRVVHAYVASIHHLLAQTPRILARARDGARARGRHDLAAYYAHKLGEEDGHAEWAAEDLEVLEAQDAAPPSGRRAPLGSMMGLVQVVEAALEQDPVRYLSYVLFAEYFTVVMGPEWVRALVDACAIPPEALTAVSKHVELDRLHVAEGLREIASLTRPEDEPRLRETLQASMDAFEAFLEELAATAERVA